MAEREVYFDQYCKQCKNETKPETDDPCDECINNPVNEDSHKPVYFEEK